MAQVALGATIDRHRRCEMSTAFEPSHRMRPIDELRVIDAMHPGMISCPPETPLRTVARMMATYRVHAILVHPHEDSPGGERWGVLTDADLVRSALEVDLDSVTAGDVAASPVLVVTTVDPLERAIQLMVEHEVTHVVAVERHSARPLGVVSTLDVARILAGLGR
jgi:CBS domain-containing protein